MAHNTSDENGDTEYPRTIVVRVTEKQWQFLRQRAEGENTSVSQEARVAIEYTRQKVELNGRKL